MARDSNVRIFLKYRIPALHLPTRAAIHKLQNSQLHKKKTGAKIIQGN